MNLWSLKQKKILVIDDFPDMRSLMKSMLFSFGSREIKEAKNGQEAVDLIEANKFDIILCDYALGKGKDGQQVLEEVKHRKLLPISTIFIMITAENTMRMVMGAVEYAPDDYLSKPFTKAELQNRLQKLMDKKENLKDISKAIDRENYGKAVALCDNKLKENPKNRTELLKSKGELLIKIGDYNAAAKIYEKVLEEREIPWAMFGLGQVRYHQKKYSDAEDIFDDIITENRSFTAAYDWLAKTLEKLGDIEKCKDILKDAIEKSPKAILRQKKLAEISLQLNEPETTEKAYREVVRIGKTSCYKSPDDYTGLAKTLLKKDSTTEALKIIGSMKKEFHEDLNADFQASVLQGVIHNGLGNKEISEAAAADAMLVFMKHPDNIPSDIIMDLAEVCFAHGRNDSASELMQHVLANDNENEKILDRTREIYKAAGLEKEADKLIEKINKEIVDINNQGVKLAQEGKIEESIELFAKASKRMPDNLIINLNAAQSLILQMQKGGNIKKHLTRAKDYLERARVRDETNETFQKLMIICHKIGATV